jgi:hypothetical protein
MATAALLVHLDPAACAAFVARLTGDPDVLVGEPYQLEAGAILPLALSSRDPAEGEARCEALRSSPGVRAVEVVMIDFSAEEQAA